MPNIIRNHSGTDITSKFPSLISSNYRSIDIAVDEYNGTVYYYLLTKDYNIYCKVNGTGSDVLLTDGSSAFSNLWVNFIIEVSGQIQPGWKIIAFSIRYLNSSGSSYFPSTVGFAVLMEKPNGTRYMFKSGPTTNVTSSLPSLTNVVGFSSAYGYTTTQTATSSGSTTNTFYHDMWDLLYSDGTIKNQSGTTVSGYYSTSGSTDIAFSAESAGIQSGWVDNDSPITCYVARATKIGDVSLYSQKGTQRVNVYSTDSDLAYKGLRVNTPNGVGIINAVNDGTHDTGYRIYTPSGVRTVKTYA